MQLEVVTQSNRLKHVPKPYIKSMEETPMVRKSNSSFGNWAVEVSATEIEFFHLKKEAVQFATAISNPRALAVYRENKDAQFRATAWNGR